MERLRYGRDKPKLQLSRLLFRYLRDCEILKFKSLSQRRQQASIAKQPSRFTYGEERYFGSLSNI